VSDKDKSVDEIRKEAKRLLRQIELEKQALARLKEAQNKEK